MMTATFTNWSPCIADSYIHIHRGKKTNFLSKPPKHHNFLGNSLYFREARQKRDKLFVLPIWNDLQQTEKIVPCQCLPPLYLSSSDRAQWKHTEHKNYSYPEKKKKIRWNFVNYSETVFWSIRVKDFRLNLFNNFIFISDLTHQNSSLKILQFFVIKWEKNKYDNL